MKKKRSSGAPVPSATPGAGGRTRTGDWRALLTTGRVVSAGLCVAVLALYGRTVTYPLLQYDDTVYVSNNPRVQDGLTAPNVAWALTSARYAYNWHPLTWLSHMVDQEVFGQWAGGHHLTSVLLHAAASVVLFGALRRLTGDVWPSAAVAALFAVHPLRVESVAWVAERKDVLSGLLFGVTLWLYAGYARRPSRRGYAAVAGAAALALMAKPMVVTLPCVLLLLDFWPLRRIDNPLSRRALPVYLEKLPLLALAAAVSVLTVVAQDDALAWGSEIGRTDRVANAISSSTAYIRQTAVPVDLAVYYPHPGGAWGVGPVVASATVLLAVTAVAVALARRAPYLIVGWLWYLGMLVPVLGLVQVGGQARADRYTYLPQIGLLIAVVWGVRDGLRLPPRVAAAAFAVAFTGLVAVAWRQVGHWRDTDALFTHALTCTPPNAVAYNNLGAAAFADGRYDEALEHFSRAVELDPTPQARRNVAQAHGGRGTQAARLGRTDEAIAEFRRALAADPTDPAARQNLATAHVNRGIAHAQGQRLAQAAAEFQLATEANPETAAAWAYLGKVRFDLQQYAGAAEAFRTALQLNPNDPSVRQAFLLAVDRTQGTRP